MDAVVAARALEVPVQVEGPHDWRIAREAFGRAVDAFDAGTDATTAWRLTLDGLAELGLG